MEAQPTTPAPRDAASGDRLYLSLLRASAHGATELRRRLGSTGEIEVARELPERAD